MSVWREVDDLCAAAEGQGFDVVVRLEVAAECAWSCEIRYTPNPNRSAKPDRSHVVFATGGGDPEYVLRRALDELQEWRSE